MIVGEGAMSPDELSFMGEFRDALQLIRDKNQMRSNASTQPRREESSPAIPSFFLA
jgi:hypothetical protein